MLNCLIEWKIKIICSNKKRTLISVELKEFGKFIKSIRYQKEHLQVRCRWLAGGWLLAEHNPRLCTGRYHALIRWTACMDVQSGTLDTGHERASCILLCVQLYVLISMNDAVNAVHERSPIVCSCSLFYVFAMIMSWRQPVFQPEYHSIWYSSLHIEA